MWMVPVIYIDTDRGVGVLIDVNVVQWLEQRLLYSGC